MGDGLKALGNGETNQLLSMELLILHALSHGIRMLILGHLIQKHGEATDQKELIDALDLSVPTVNYHLMILRDANLVLVEDSPHGIADRYIARASSII